MNTEKAVVRDFFANAPLEDLEAELRVRDDVGGWAR